MTFANYEDAVSQLIGHGLLLDTAKKTHGGALVGQLYIDSAKPVKVKAEGGGSQGGWYWLAEKEIGGKLCITGAFGIYQGADIGKQSLKVRLDGKAVSMSAEEKAAIKARHEANMKRAAAMRKAEADRAASEATRVWQAYVPTGESDYLKRKGVGAHGLRFSPSGNGTVAVPMLRGGLVVGLQIIRGKAREGKLEKEYFPAGMDKTGAHHLIGRIVAGGVAIVAEGYATGATIYEALGATVPVAVAFDANSLLPVAQAIAKDYRGVRLVFAADDDRIQRCRECKNYTPVEIERCIHCDQLHSNTNPGISLATNAAHAVDGTVVVPKFAAERPNDKKGPNDFNDLHAIEGLHVVRAQLEAHLAGIKAHVPGAAPARATEGAGRDNWGGGEGSANGNSGGGSNAMPRIIDPIDAIARYSLIYGGKGTWFDHHEHALVPKSDALDIMPRSAANEIKLRGGLPVVRLSEVGFDPAETDPNIRCNLWGGWPTTPRAGKCTMLLSVLEHLCAEERNARDLYKWVLKWLAYPIQHPGAKMRTALVFHGPQGVGKNLFFEAVMGIYGKYGRIVDQAAVEDKFNDWMGGKLFLIADEVVARNELFHLKNKLKGIVTGEWIRINPKNVAAHDERNHVNLVFLSNERQPIVLEKDDRRYFVVWTPEKMDRAFYDDVKAELAAGAIPALHQYLLDLDLGDFNEHTPPPQTKSKDDLIALGAESVERFLADWQGNDIAFDDGPLPFGPCGSADLYTAYKRWCVIEGVNRPREQAAFKGHIVKLHQWSVGHRDRFKDEYGTGATIRCRMVFPSPAAMDAAATMPGSLDLRKPEGKTQAGWLTECFFAFQHALGRQP